MTRLYYIEGEWCKEDKYKKYYIDRFNLIKKDIYKRIIRAKFDCDEVSYYWTYRNNIIDENLADIAFKLIKEKCSNYISKKQIYKPKETNKIFYYPGIYQIKNIITNECYIGSSNNIQERFYSHKTLLNSNKHHCKKLQESWNTYGKENFVFYKREYVSDESLLKYREREWIEKVKNNHILLNTGSPVNYYEYEIYLLKEEIKRLKNKIAA